MRKLPTPLLLAVLLLALGPSRTSHAISPPHDWRWVHGAVYLPTNCVNEAEMWDEYNPLIIDRELHCAGIYGINCVRVFLHYDIYLKNKSALLDHVEDFLRRADHYGIKTDFIFFDDCWNQPPKEILQADYQYPAPLFGVHNSQWLVSPGADVLDHYDQHQTRLKSYVQDIVNPHKSDPRIAFWEIYNEPNHSAATTRLGSDAFAWIKETRTEIPITATGAEFSGDAFSDFKSWHNYDALDHLHLKGDPITALCTECMNRQTQSIPGIIDAFKNKTGFIIWEFGIGRDNCRFSWNQNRDHPATGENVTPFHGMVYPDAHPWSVDDVKSFLGPDAFAKTPLFTVEYFTDDGFQNLAKKSIAPFIDFDRPDEVGIGSPDSSAHISKDHYSCRWTGIFAPTTDGSYTFFADGDNAIKLTLDGQTLINKTDPARSTVAATTVLTKNSRVTVTVEYAHAMGASSLHLTVQPPHQSRQLLLPALPVAQ